MAAGAPGVRGTLLLLALLWLPPVQAAEVEVKGLFAGRAILNIDGEVVMLKVGMSRNGVTLVAADSREAVVDIDGEVYQLGVSRKISSAYRAAEVQEVRLQPRRGGHYLTPARINNKPVEVMIDTGATAVAMSLPQAKALGIDYRNGRLLQVSTANGLVDSYLVMLDSVTVGPVRVDNVEALVNMSNFPDTVLLGNSYLSRVEMFRENGVLVLQSQY
ncbi:TIGR02281 family clan AA aspartic protease [Pseudomaricurvus alcaniphilus]|uniref:retropepsin-like aspartic protease family protein n=1 Tax=Pseudomaricurvus alcaniphilus TaxID=1166482 RepID=UPI00140C514E|nr:TIGR02281 family clan AA aspartic protease [Pseudomaricurvus alcaniphilus]NHN38913.1 TIGR02281 family clan AA aspartic protease [Pseudomaricurvus alcaniphilus]